MKDTTIKLNEVKDKVASVQTESNRKSNEIARLTELLQVEKERNSRNSSDVEEFRVTTAKLNATITSLKEDISKLREAVKREVGVCYPSAPFSWYKINLVTFQEICQIS